MTREDEDKFRAAQVPVWYPPLNDTLPIQVPVWTPPKRDVESATAHMVEWRPQADTWH